MQSVFGSKFCIGSDGINLERHSKLQFHEEIEYRGNFEFYGGIYDFRTD